MLQLDTLRGAANTDCANVNVSNDTSTGSYLSLSPSAHGLGMGAMTHWATNFSNVNQQQEILQQQQQPPSVELKAESEEEEDNEYRPFTPPPPRERLSYTRYQLELLNGIYQEVRYPNSTQKQLIAKRVGITREQVKIWFQNRRRKDVVTKSTGKKSCSKSAPKNGALQTVAAATAASPLSPGSNNENSNPADDVSSCGDNKDVGTIEIGGQEVPLDGLDVQNAYHHNSSATSGSLCNIQSDVSETSNINSCNVSQLPVNLSSLNETSSSSSSSSSSSQLTMVSQVVLKSMIAELSKFDNEYLKLKKSKKKKHKKSTKPNPPSSELSPCNAQGLFQNFDMIAPPNKVTPTAFLNTSANLFKHAGGTSAFQNPRESRLASSGNLANNEGRSWEGFNLNPTLPSATNMPSDLLPPKSNPDVVHSSLSSSLNFSNPPHHPQLGGFLPGTASHPLSHSQAPVYENIPVLSDLLGNYKTHPTIATPAMAAAQVQRQLEQSMSASAPPGQPPSAFAAASGYFHLPGGSTAGSSTFSSSNSDCSKSPSSDISFPPSPSQFHIHHPQPTHFAFNRIFPFPLIADPPVVLSSLRQSESFGLHSPWHSGPPLGSPLNSTVSPHGGTPTAAGVGPTGLSEDLFRPLMISSLSNPYFSPQSSTYSLPAPASTQLWPLQPPDSSTTNLLEL